MYRNILVPLDGSSLAECVLPHVEAIARSCQPARVVLAKVVDSDRLPIVSESWGPKLQAKLKSAREHMEADEKDQASAYLEGIKKRLNLGPAVETATIEGARPAESLLDYALDNGIDLIVIATHGRSGLSRWVYGSVAENILLGVSSPIFLVKPG